MRPRYIYAHWLDPDYMGKYALPRDQFRRRFVEFETILKDARYPWRLDLYQRRSADRI